MRRVGTAFLLLAVLLLLSGCSVLSKGDQLTIRVNNGLDGPPLQVAVWQHSRGQIATISAGGSDQVTLPALKAGSESDFLSVSFPPDATRYQLDGWGTQTPLSGRLTVDVGPVSDKQVIEGAYLDQTSAAPQGGVMHGLYPDGY